VKKFGAARWVFSLKMFLAAMMAYVVSVHIGLPQSYWALVTCVIVMNPMTGAVRAKALYRFAGTLFAGIASLLLASAFASTPTLMIASVGLTATVAFGLAMLDRTPRAYGAQLFGVTLMLVAVAGINQPEHMFDTAISRICEISVGIACCSFVDSIIAPGSLSNAWRQRLDGWLSHMETWVGHAFQGHVGDKTVEQDRLRIIADISAMSTLAGQLRYDPMVSKWERQCIFAIQQKLLRMIPLLSSIAATIRAQSEPDRQVVIAWLRDIVPQVRDGRFGNDVLEQFKASASQDDTQQAWHGLLREYLAELATQALAAWSDVKRIEAALKDRRVSSLALRRYVQRAKPFPLHPDLYIAGRVAGGILLAYTVLCGLWWATGWNLGPNAVLMGIVGVAFFGTLDEAGKAIAIFGRFGAMALLLAGFICYGLLPLAQDFPSLALLLGLVMLPLGAWAATNPMAILLLALSLSSINLQAHYSPPDFDVFVESSFSTLLGIFVAYVSVGLVRQMGAEHVVQRYAKMQRAEIAALTRRAGPRERDNYANRALDRIAAAVSRLGATNNGDPSIELASWMRAGVAVAAIRQASAQLDPALRQSSEALLAAVRTEVAGNEPSAALLERIDQTLSAACKTARVTPSLLIRGLVGLRLALFEHSPGWEPAR